MAIKFFTFIEPNGKSYGLVERADGTVRLFHDRSDIGRFDSKEEALSALNKGPLSDWYPRPPHALGKGYLTDPFDFEDAEMAGLLEIASAEPVQQ